MPKHLVDFDYVNGGLFANDLAVPAIGAKTRRMMIKCGQLEWSRTNPDIFGSMFQAVLDEAERVGPAQPTRRPHRAPAHAARAEA